MIADFTHLPLPRIQAYLQHAVAPRPICLASTVDRAGQVNLSPFSFFNLFSSNPPILVFSPSRRLRDGSTKHTLENLLEVPEVGIHIVDYDMVQQVSLASCEYPRGVNEFTKAGFTQETARLIRPPLVKESKIRMECRVNEIKPLGEQGGAGNLVICQVLLMHIDDSLLDQNQMIDQTRIEHVARLGANWYCRVNPSSLFEVEKPNIHIGIGVDALPRAIARSPFLSGNHLGQLANVDSLPALDPAFCDDRLKNIIQYFGNSPDEMERELHIYAAELLDEGKLHAAWQVLLTLN